jgi:hypothetical protein
MGTNVLEEPVASVFMIQKYFKSVSLQFNVSYGYLNTVSCFKMTSGQRKGKTIHSQAIEIIRSSKPQRQRGAAENRTLQPVCRALGKNGG